MAEKVASNSRLLQHLIQSGQVTEGEVRAAAARQKEVGGDLLEHLLETGVLTEEGLARALSVFYRVPRVNLTRVRVTKRALRRATPEFCRRNQVLPFGTDAHNDELLVATADPSQVSAIDALRFGGDQKIRLYVAERSQLAKAIEFYYFSGVLDGKATERRGSVGGRIRPQEPSGVAADPPADNGPHRTRNGDAPFGFEPADSGGPFEDPAPDESAPVRGEVPGTEDLGAAPMHSDLFDQAPPSREPAGSSVLRRPSSGAGRASPPDLGPLNPFLKKVDDDIPESLQNRLDQLEEAIRRLEKALRYEMSVSQAMAEVLVENGLISSEQLKSRLRNR